MLVAAVSSTQASSRRASMPQQGHQTPSKKRSTAPRAGNSALGAGPRCSVRKRGDMKQGRRGHPPTARAMERTDVTIPSNLGLSAASWAQQCVMSCLSSCSTVLSPPVVAAKSGMGSRSPRVTLVIICASGLSAHGRRTDCVCLPVRAHSRRAGRLAWKGASASHGVCQVTSSQRMVPKLQAAPRQRGQQPQPGAAAGGGPAAPEHVPRSAELLVGDDLWSLPPGVGRQR